MSLNRTFICLFLLLFVLLVSLILAVVAVGWLGLCGCALRASLPFAARIALEPCVFACDGSVS